MKTIRMKIIVIQETGSQHTKSLGSHRKKVKNVRRLLSGSTILNSHTKSHVQELQASARRGIQSVTEHTMTRVLLKLQSLRGREWSCSISSLPKTLSLRKTILRLASQLISFTSWATSDRVALMQIMTTTNGKSL